MEKQQHICVCVTECIWDMKLIALWNIYLSNKYFHIQLNVEDRVYLSRENRASLFAKESVMHLMMNRSVVKIYVTQRAKHA
jgi:hypothetical protein